MSYPNSYTFDSEMDQLSQSILAPLGEAANQHDVSSSSFAVPHSQTQVYSSQQSQQYLPPMAAAASASSGYHSTQEIPLVPSSTPGSSGLPTTVHRPQARYTAPAMASSAAATMIPEGMVPQHPDPSAFMPPPEPTPHVPGSSYMPLFSSANSEVFRQKRGRGGGGGGLSRGGGRGAPSSWRPNRLEQQNMENKKIRAENTELRDNIAWIRSELTNLPGKVQKEVTSSLEQSEQPVLEEVCSLRSTVEETMASVETVKVSVEAVGRAVGDMHKSEAEAREQLKRSVEERVSRIEALLFPKQEMTKKVSSGERTPRRRDASLVGRLPSFTVSPIAKPRDKSVSMPLNSTSITDFELGSGGKDLLRTTLNDNDRSSTEDLFEVKTEKDEAESTWQSLKAAGGATAPSASSTSSRRSVLLPRLPAKQEKEEKSDAKRVILEDVIDVSEDEEDSDEELIFS